MERIVCGLVVLTALGIAALAESGTERTVVHLQLEGALFQTEPSAGTADLAIELERRSGVWGPVFALARDFNMGTHWGTPDRVSLTDTALEATVRLEVAGDPWVKGGRADFTVRAKRDGAILTGAFEGAFRGRSVKGAATGLVLEPRAPAGFVPLKRGEHPRILFRKTDVPRLKRLLDTPFGRAARGAMRRDPVYKAESPVSAMDSAVWLGVEHQMTGDKSFAERAWTVTQAIMADKNRAAFVPEVTMAWQIERVTLAYDLCHDAWPEAARQEVRVWLLNWFTRVMKDPQAIYQKGNWHVGSNHTAMFYGAIGFVGLALFDDPGPLPQPPTARWRELDVPAARDLVVKPGTPVVPLVAGSAPTEWLLAAPFPSMLAGDPMAGLQGLENLHPGPGDTATIEEMTIKFEPIRAEDRPSGNTGGIGVERFLKNGSVSLAAYTVIECGEPGLYRLLSPFSLAGRPQLAVNGKLLAHEQIVRLEKGRYALTLLLRLGAKWSAVAPRFVKATEEDVAASAKTIADIEAGEERARKAFEAALAFHRATGGADPEMEKVFRWTRWHMWIFARDIVGDGGTGYEAGMDWDIHRVPAAYHAAYRRVFGFPLSPFPDMSHIWPRRMMQAVYTDNAMRQGKNMNGSAGFDRDSLAGEFALLPDAWKPSALWVWQRLVGVRDPANPVEVLQCGRSAAEALLNYPYDIEKGGSTIAPAHPGAFLPHSWAAPWRGHFIFRNGARSADDCIVQVYAKAREISGWQSGNAGAFRLYGLGYDWVHNGTAEHGTSLRMQESVVDLPDDPTFARGCGAVVHHGAAADGSGAVTIDLRDVYAGTPPGHAYQTYGGSWRAALIKDIGTRGTRSVGVDYSGASGAPCLLVVVDRIEGGKRKVWRWPLDKIAANATVDGNAFTVRQGDATLRATFVAPGDVKVSAGSESKSYIEPTFNRQRNDSVHGVFAEAPAGDALFFVVATLQKGDAPKVEATGKGADTVVKVGGQTVRFKDGKVIFGK